MKSTALGAENIIFISDAHEKFYYEKLQEVRYQDVYHKALQENPQTGHDSFNKSAQYRNRVQTCSRGRRNDRERKRTVWKVGNDTVCIWNRPTYLPYRIHQEQDTDGKESGGLQLHGRGTGIDTHEPKYELICSIRFEESTVYGAKHRTY